MIVTALVQNVYKPVAEEVGEVASSMDEGRDIYLITPHYYLNSEIAFYERAKFAGYSLLFRVYKHPNAAAASSYYSPWIPPEDLIGRDMVFVDEKRNPDNFETPVSFWEEKLPPYFERVEGPIIFEVKKKGQPVRSFYIFKCFGFKGPDSEMDKKGEARDYLDRMHSRGKIKEKANFFSWKTVSWSKKGEGNRAEIPLL